MSAYTEKAAGQEEDGEWSVSEVGLRIALPFRAAEELEGGNGAAVRPGHNDRSSLALPNPACFLYGSVAPRRLFAATEPAGRKAGARRAQRAGVGTRRVRVVRWRLAVAWGLDRARRASAEETNIALRRGCSGAPVWPPR